MLVGQVLLVEDDPLARRALIRAVGKQVAWVVAETVTKAISILDGQPLAGAIVDVQLPDGSGFEIAKRIRAVSSRTPILMISGRDPHDLIKGGFAFDVTVMSKPVSSADIVEWLRRATLANAPNPLDAHRAHALLRFARQHRLKPDQVGILRQRIAGVRNRVIAAELGISVDAVKKRMNRILAATGLRNVRELAAAIDALASDE